MRLLVCSLVLASGVDLIQAQTPTFLARTDYPDAGSYNHIVLADFNNDGILDIAHDNGDGGGPQIFFGNGDGTFCAGPSNTPTGIDSGIATGDLNGDGKADLVIATLEATTQIYYGNGDGTFQVGPSLNIGAYTYTIADVNGDGLPDILASSIGVVVLLNQGGGAFGPSTTYLPGTLVYTIAVADLNGDGLPDMIAGAGSGAQVFLGTGGGKFQSGQAIQLQDTAGSLVVADMDGDGKLDLVATGGDDIFDPRWNQVSILTGNGDGTFSPHSIVSRFRGVSGVQVGDLDVDGKPDLVMLQENSQYQISVAFNLGNGYFGTPVPYFAAEKSQSFAIGPLRKPGLLDIVVDGAFTYYTSVLLNQGKGAFLDGEYIPMPTPPGPFAPGDFNGDGLVDFAVVTSSGVSTYQNSGQGYGPYALTHTYALASPTWIAAADFNKDGSPDLAVSLAGGGIAILLGQGAGRFAAPVMLASGIASMIVTGDFNNDGNVDIAATSNEIFFGNGHGGFSTSQPLLGFLMNHPLVWLSPISANNDSYLDLAVLTANTEGGDDLHILLNRGNGAFSLGSSTSAAQASSQMLVADFNGDGNQDLMIFAPGMYYLTGAVSLLSGDGKGNFQEVPFDCSICFTTTGHGVAGDFNRDGFADVAITTGQNLAVFLGNGDFTFQNPIFVGTATELEDGDIYFAGPTFLKYVEMQNTHSGPRFAFVAPSGNGICIEIQTGP